MPGAYGGKQLLHLVFGGEAKQSGGTEFRDLDALDIDGVYLHRLLEPGAEGSGSK